MTEDELIKVNWLSSGTYLVCQGRHLEVDTMEVSVMFPVNAEHDSTSTAAVQHMLDNFALSEGLKLLSLDYHKEPSCSSHGGHLEVDPLGKWKPV